MTITSTITIDGLAQRARERARTRTRLVNGAMFALEQALVGPRPDVDLSGSMSAALTDGGSPGGGGSGATEGTSSPGGMSSTGGSSSIQEAGSIGGSTTSGGTDAAA